MRYLPNVLSALRVLMGIVVCVAAAAAFWNLALWVFIPAALSDMIDGPLARRLKVVSHLGYQLDRAGDLTLFAGSCIGIALGVGVPVSTVIQSGIGFMIAFSLTVWRKSSTGTTHRQFASGAIALVTLLFILGGLLATQAYGWHWWYLVIGVSVGACVAVVKRGHLVPNA